MQWPIRNISLLILKPKVIDEKFPVKPDCAARIYEKVEKCKTNSLTSSSNRAGIPTSLMTLFIWHLNFYLLSTLK